MRGTKLSNGEMTLKCSESQCSNVIIQLTIFAVFFKILFSILASGTHERREGNKYLTDRMQKDTNFLRGNRFSLNYLAHTTVRLRCVRQWTHIVLDMLYKFVAAWVVRSKAATERYFWITHSCLT